MGLYPNQHHTMQQSIGPDLMMALARISASQMVLLPPTVAPAQVSMSPGLHQVGDPLLQGNIHGRNVPAVDNPLESFARIEFADSVFQMTTYSVIIGRDQRALTQARRDERREDEYQRRVEENAAQGLPPPSPPSQDRGKFSKSYVSEEGGMLGPESDGDEPRPAKRRKTSGGGGSASGELATRDACRGPSRHRCQRQESYHQQTVHLPYPRRPLLWT